MKFNPSIYSNFKHIRDETFPAVIIEGQQKLEYITSLCKHQNLCIQAGCNFGIFPHYLSQVFETVITTEPSPVINKYARENLSAYDNIVLLDAGFGASTGSCTEVFDSTNCGATQLNTSKPGEIELITIDSIMCNYNFCDLIYLDIEGMEYQALQGAREIILKYKPVIVVENKGLIPEFEENNQPNFLPNGNQGFRDKLSEEFGYTFYKRLMRDDIFLPIDT